MPKKNKFMNRGAAILSICFALFFFVILGRMAYIQITGKANGEVLATKATEQHEKKRTIEEPRLDFRPKRKSHCRGHSDV